MYGVPVALGVAVFLYVRVVDVLNRTRTVCAHSVGSPRRVFLKLCETAAPINSLLIRRGPGPNKFTRKYLSNFFKFMHLTKY